VFVFIRFVFLFAGVVAGWFCCSFRHHHKSPESPPHQTTLHALRVLTSASGIPPGDEGYGLVRARVASSINLQCRGEIHFFV
jgi:hypothetical protein